MHILDRQDEATVRIAASYTYTVHVHIIRIQNDKMAGIFYMVKKLHVYRGATYGGGGEGGGGVLMYDIMAQVWRMDSNIHSKFTAIPGK